MSEIEAGNLKRKIEVRKFGRDKNDLKTEMLNLRDAKAMSKEATDWVEKLYDVYFLKRSGMYKLLELYETFQNFILIPVDGAEDDDAFDVPEDYSSIQFKTLKQLMKVVKGCKEDVIESWLTEIAPLSYSDAKKLIEAKEGKEPHDCGPFIEVRAWKCTACNKVREKEADGGA